MKVVVNASPLIFLGKIGRLDLVARRRAGRMGLRVMGTVGILLLSCKKGCLSSDHAKGALDDLCSRHNLYLSEAMRSRFLREVEK